LFGGEVKATAEMVQISQVKNDWHCTEFEKIKRKKGEKVSRLKYIWKEQPLMNTRVPGWCCRDVALS